MTRRLRMAGIGVLTFMLPACMGPSRQAATGNAVGPNYVLNPQGNSSSRQQVLGSQPVYHAGTDQKFGPIVPEPGTKVAQQVPEKPPVEVIGPDLSKTAAPTVESPLTDPVKAPTEVQKPAVCEPRGTAAMDEPVRAPEWPSLPGGIGETKNLVTPVGAPQTDPVAPPVFPGTMEPAPAPMNNVVAPPADAAVPMPPLNVALKVPDPVTPEVAPAVPPMTPPALPAAVSTGENILIQAIKALQANRPEAAAAALRNLDPANQEMLMDLMPLLVRLGEGSIGTMTPEETAVLVDRLQHAAGVMRAKAALRVEHVCFCRGVRKFADVDPYDPRHEFRPGDMVFLYAELKNFTCEPVAPQSRQSAQRSYAIRLATTLELRDAQNSLVWRTDLNKTDFAQSPPLDYYHTYRFCIPERLPPGVYTLWLNVADKPTGRAVRKPVELRVGQN
jgi:hypothetical protein